MIGIVTLNYNSWEMTFKSIKSIFNIMGENKKFRIYIIDNNSDILPSCEFLDYIRDKENINITYLDTNRGYSAGNNIGIKMAKADFCDFILIANNDIIFEHNSIIGMKNFLEENLEYSVVGPKIYLPNGEIQEINMLIETTILGKYMYLLRKTPFRFLSRKYVDLFQKKPMDLPDMFDVHSVSGCCFMMNKKAFDVLTPFDEDFFLYYEEYVFGLIAQKNKIKIAYCTKNSVIHEHSQSTKRIGINSYIYFVQSELIYFKKYQKNGVIKILPLYFIRSLTMFAKTIFRKNFFANNFKYINKTFPYLLKRYRRI